MSKLPNICAFFLILISFFSCKKDEKISEMNRKEMSKLYIKGSGIEIGALHLPTTVYNNAKVKYLDYLSKEELRSRYPELKEYDIVDVDIVDDAEYMAKVEDNSQDFIIANHFFEHCQNIILTMKNLNRVLKPNGILYMAIPDKRYSFDKKREITPYEHIVDEYINGPEKNYLTHVKEWVTLVNGATDSLKIQEGMQSVIETKYSIHYHVWDYYSLNETIMKITRDYVPELNLEASIQTQKNGNEIIVILRKKT